MHAASVPVLLFTVLQRLLAVAVAALLCALTQPLGAQQGYEPCPASRDGIGKCYMGREIALVLGHLGADWLERAEREEEERPSIMIRNLGSRRCRCRRGRRHR
jgi:hypothetical protein